MLLCIPGGCFVRSADARLGKYSEILAIYFHCPLSTTFSNIQSSERAAYHESFGFHILTLQNLAGQTRQQRDGKSIIMKTGKTR